MTMKKAVFLLLMICLSPTMLMAEEFKEGVEFTAYSRPFPVSTGDKVEVKEIFWYGCPHCFNLEKPLEKWRKEKMPANVQFIRMPAVFRENWIPHARAYYAFEALNKTEELHHALMNAIHVKRQKIMTKDQIADFVATQGVDRKEFLDAYNSFSVDSLSRQAAIMTKRYGISGVPSIVVDGRYLTSASKTGMRDLFEAVDYLVDKATDLRTKENTAPPTE